MAVTTDRHSAGSRPEFSSAPRSGRGAADAAARVWLASAALGVLGLVLALFVVSRLVEKWRVTPQAAHHHISILGQRLSYPTANLDAIVILVLAAVGLVVVALTVAGAARELAADRAFRRRLDAAAPQPRNGVWVIDDDRPQAFCVGLFRPRVYISSGAVAALDQSALDAVLAHERHHAQCRDPLRLAAGRILAHAVFFVPGLRTLVGRQVALAELGADERAINAAAEHRSALARAMLTFTESSGHSGSVGIDPQRVDHLLGEAPSWSFPVLVCAAAVAVIGLLAAVVVLAGRVAVGSATVAPPFFSSQPCIVVLALIPIAALLVTVGTRGIVRARGL